MQSYPKAFHEFHQAMTQLLTFPYGQEAGEIAARIVRRVQYHLHENPPKTVTGWSEKDIFLITYGDTLYDNSEQPPLQVLKGFLDGYLNEVINTLHILPYLPYSSDDGFSVIDYLSVNEQLGSWQDIEAIASDYQLMSDLVINHVSRESLWFADFVSGHQPGRDYFIEEDPETDLSEVTRPRNSPLLVPIHTRRGLKHVWATFSEDQMDLNFKNPDVLIQMVDVLLFYLARGTMVVRLDAVAFLWKKPGTHCINLPETHAIVKLFRLIMERACPGSTLLTETNVPHEENISYFGEQDEAHMVYQFALPPLILHALNRGTEKYLVQWARNLPDYPESCTVLNFTASHDGIGLRPLTGVIPENEVSELIDSMHRFGGFVSMRTLSDNTESPYEINIALFDAMKGTRRGEDQWQVQRFLCSQLIMLGMRGIPAFYIHSLFATHNDLAGVESSGRTRSINRRKWLLEELLPELENPVSIRSLVFHSLLNHIKVRKQEPCFHPNASQTILDMAPGIFAFLRTSPCGRRKLVAIHNLTSAHQTLNQPDYVGWSDLLGSGTIQDLQLKPYQVLWLAKTP
ncbi:sugar phosphorylase [Endozoicomonas sp. ALC020]|uniref:sugar phosphorylase n=1 Tax=unclassified Endozoicomonas TaxID=2644528 RepID=UPI003BAEE0E0